MKVILSLLILLITLNAYAADSHYEAARKLVQFVEKGTNIEELSEPMVNALLVSKPEYRPFKSVFMSFFIKILSSEEYKEGLAKIYQETYTLEELEYANQVFSDPRLTSYFRKSPAIFGKSMLFSQHLASQHKEELKAALEARAEELEALSNSSSNKTN